MKLGLQQEVIILHEDEQKCMAGREFQWQVSRDQRHICCHRSEKVYHLREGRIEYWGSIFTAFGNKSCIDRPAFGFHGVERAGWMLARHGGFARLLSIDLADL